MTAIYVAGGFICAAALFVCTYLLYMIVTYKRVPDRIKLPISTGCDDPMDMDREIKIVSWNIGFGAYSDDYSFFMNGGTESRAFSKDAVLQNISSDIFLLSKENADIILLQEVDTDSTRAYHVNQRDMFTEAFSDYSYTYAQNYNSKYLLWPLRKPHGASKSGILTMVHGKIVDSLRRQLPIENGFMKFLDLDRCYSVNTVPLRNGKNLYLYTLHLSAYTSDGSIATEQIKILLNNMNEKYQAGNYVIAGGDFNKDIWQDSALYTGVQGKDYSWSKPFPIELIPAGFTIVNTLNRDKVVTSCRASDTAYFPGRTFTVTLDAFIVSDNIRVKAAEVIDAGFRNSDHNPIRMTFRFDDSE